MTTVENARQRLVSVIRHLAEERKARLTELKQVGASLAQRDDFLWHGLLLSFSTMGSSRGYEGLILNPSLYKCVTFDALQALSADQRLPVLKATLRSGKVRMPDRKAEWLSENFKKIVSMGGPAHAKEMLENCSGKEAKIRFLRSFRGIGPKYARNIMMDSYHPEFRHSIAVDERIKNVSKKLGLALGRYEDEEQFYLSVAHAVGLEGWELDRLIYNFLQEILNRL